MRMRFSLRTLFVVTTAASLLCGWVVLPWVSAKRLIRALASENYPLADRYFRNPEDRFFVAWADKRWAFRATGELAPWTFTQLVRGRREVAVRLTYFDLDQNAVCTARISAAPFTIGSPTLSPVSYVGVIIDDRGNRATPIRK